MSQSTQGANFVYLDPDTLVHRYAIIGADEVIYAVWHRQTRSLLAAYGGGGHTITTYTAPDGSDAWWFRGGTEDLPADLDALPYGPERTVRVTAWQQAIYAAADALILRAFPEAHAGRAVCGDRTISGDHRLTVAVWSAATVAAGWTPCPHCGWQAASDSHWGSCPERRCLACHSPARYGHTGICLAVAAALPILPSLPPRHRRRPC